MNNDIIQKDERNYGIDFLRVFSMFLVIILHCFGQGGILGAVIEGTMQYKVAWLLEIFAYCAVDIFGLISGYVAYSEKDKEFSFSKYIYLWLEVVFYSLTMAFIYNLINPELVSKNDYIKALLPVTNGPYWYFTAYTALFAVMPFLNIGLRACNKSTLKKLFIVIILTFSVFNTIFPRFTLGDGYSFIWLMLLYILGATIKKCEIGKDLKKFKAFIGIIILCIITYLYKNYGLTGKIFDIEISKDLLVSYTSPTVLLCAILYLISFSKIKFNKTFKKLIKFAAPSAFSVYILNTNTFFWIYTMQNLFIYSIVHSTIFIIINVIAFSIVFVTISILIDKVRIIIFKILHIKEFTIKSSNLLKSIINKLSFII